MLPQVSSTTPHGFIAPPSQCIIAFVSNVLAVSKNSLSVKALCFQRSVVYGLLEHYAIRSVSGDIAEVSGILVTRYLCETRLDYKLACLAAKLVAYGLLRSKCPLSMIPPFDLPRAECGYDLR